MVSRVVVVLRFPCYSDKVIELEAPGSFMCARKSKKGYVIEGKDGGNECFYL